MSVRSPDNLFAAVRSGKTHILMALSAFVIMVFAIFLLAAILSPGPGSGANPAAARGDVPTSMSRR